MTVTLIILVYHRFILLKKSHISRDAAGPATVAPEKPNPTVFDRAVCKDELPPVRISSDAFKGIIKAVHSLLFQQ